MQRLALRTQRQQGITLIESLIALIIAALGILGIIGVQMRTLTDTSTTVRRAQAIRLIEDLSERMKANPNALAVIDSYLSDFDHTPSVGNCSSGCTNAQQAAVDLAVWKQSIKVLPLGQAKIFTPPAENGLAQTSKRQLGVMLAWRENEADTSSEYKDAIDTTKIKDSSGNYLAGAGSAAACPANFTCHLQYIPVSARCAPYNPSGGAVGATTQFYCAGS